MSVTLSPELSLVKTRGVIVNTLSKRGQQGEHTRAGSEQVDAMSALAPKYKAELLK